ncbi:MAG TPA: hypothetical protein VIY29_05050 [Ktedonobacteraceae bacterium]
MSTLPLHFSALARKSIADVTRRRLRTLLVVLGIAIGVLGLTAINVASDALSASLSFSANRSSAPDLSFSVQAVDSSLASTLAAVPNVKAVQFDTQYIPYIRTVYIKEETLRKNSEERQQKEKRYAHAGARAGAAIRAGLAGRPGVQRVSRWLCRGVRDGAEDLPARRAKDAG